MGKSQLVLPSTQLKRDQFVQSGEAKERALFVETNSLNRGNVSIVGQDNGLTANHDIDMVRQLRTFEEFYELNVNGIDSKTPHTDAYYRWKELAETYYHSDAYGGFYKFPFIPSVFNITNGFKIKFNNISIENGDVDEDDAYINLKVDDGTNYADFTLRFSEAGLKVYNNKDASQIGSTITHDFTVLSDILIGVKIIAAQLNISVYHKDSSSITWTTGFTDTNAFMDLIAQDQSIIIGSSNSEHEHSISLSSYEFRYIDDDGFANGLPGASIINNAHIISQAVIDEVIKISSDAVYNVFGNDVRSFKVSDSEVIFLYNLIDGADNSKYKLVMFKYDLGTQAINLIKEFLPKRGANLQVEYNHIWLDKESIPYDTTGVNRYYGPTSIDKINEEAYIVGNNQTNTTYFIGAFDLNDLGSGPLREITTRTTGGLRINPIGISYDNLNNYVWVSDYVIAAGSGKIVAYLRTDVGVAIPTKEFSVSYHPKGIAVYNNELFVCDPDNNAIKIYNMSGILQRTITGLNTGLINPYDICVMPSRNEILIVDIVTVVDGIKKAILVFDINDNGNIIPKRSLAPIGETGEFRYLDICRYDEVNDVVWVNQGVVGSFHFIINPDTFDIVENDTSIISNPRSGDFKQNGDILYVRWNSPLTNMWFFGYIEDTVNTISGFPLIGFFNSSQSDYILYILSFDPVLFKIQIDIIQSSDGGTTWDGDLSDDLRLFIIGDYPGISNLHDHSNDLRLDKVLLSFTADISETRIKQDYTLNVPTNSKHMICDTIGHYFWYVFFQGIRRYDEYSGEIREISYDATLNPLLDDPFGIAYSKVGNDEHIYVSTSGGKLLKYDAQSFGTVPPVASRNTFVDPEAKGITYNPDTNEIILVTIDIFGTPKIRFFDASDLGLNRQVDGAATRLDDPYDVVYIGGVNEEFAVLQRGSNEISIYRNASTISGNTAPQRWLSGANTLITDGYALHYDEINDQIILAQYNDSLNNDILVFDNPSDTPGGIKNIAPALTLQLNNIDGGKTLDNFVAVCLNSEDEITIRNIGPFIDGWIGMHELRSGALSVTTDLFINKFDIGTITFQQLYTTTVGNPLGNDNEKNVGGLEHYKRSSGSNDSILIFSDYNVGNAVDLISHLIIWTGTDWSDSGTDIIEISSIHVDPNNFKQFHGIWDNVNDNFFLYVNTAQEINEHYLYQATVTADGVWTKYGIILTEVNNDRKGNINFQSYEWFNNSLIYIFAVNNIYGIDPNDYFLFLPQNILNDYPANDSAIYEVYHNLMRSYVNGSLNIVDPVITEYGYHWRIKFLSNSYIPLSSSFHLLTDNIDVDFNGTIVYEGDTWRAYTQAALVGISTEVGDELASISPSEISIFSNTGSDYIIEFDATQNGNSFDKFIFNSFCIININFIEAIIMGDNTATPNWTTPAFSQTINAYHPETYIFTCGTVVNNYIPLTIPYDIAYSYIGSYIKVINGSDANSVYQIVDCDGYGFYLNDNAQANGLASGDTIHVFIDRAFGVTSSFPLVTSVQRYRHIALKIPAQNTVLNDFRVGKFIIGVGVKFSQARTVPYNDTFISGIQINRSQGGQVYPRINSSPIFKTEIVWRKVKDEYEKEVSEFLKAVQYKLYNFAMVLNTSDSFTQQEINNFKLLRLENDYGFAHTLGDDSIMRTKQLTLIEDK
jgi:hypothetical protein